MLQGFLRLGLKGPYLDMLEFNSTLSVDRVSSDIQGIMGGGAGNDFYNRAIEEMVPELLRTYSREISQVISDVVMPVANKELNQMTLADLLRDPGEGGNEISCIVEQ